MANDTASTANAGAGPAKATSSPPITGPSSDPICVSAVEMAFAA